MMSSTKNMRFQKFEPRQEIEGANDGLEYGMDFSFNPTKFYCKHHPTYEAEFCCEINNSFYCKKCQPDHREHRDRVLASIPYELQKKLIQLRNTYSQKKEVLVKKLDAHQGKVEDIFKMFYDALDTMRKTMLKQEYEMRAKMDHFENQTKALVQQLKTYSLVEFFHEETAMQSRIAELMNSLDNFNIYLPQTQVIIKDVKRAEKDIMVDLRERLNGYIMTLNHDFALSNYQYVMDHIGDKTVRDIYKVLGPFDHFSHRDADDDLDLQRDLKMEFDIRKSGAQFRG